MDRLERQEISSEVPDSQEETSFRSPGNRNALAPRNVIELINLAEIEAMWGVGEDRIYRAVERGRLHAYGRPGRRRFYSLAELLKLLGPPTTRTTPPALTRRDNRERNTGGQQQGFEFASAPVAA